MKMKSRHVLWMVFSILVTNFSLVAIAEMVSENYHMQCTVFSGGGIMTGSTNYLMNNTIGQPSPLIDPLKLPLSNTYDLYPGFWYVVADFESSCSGDFNGDKDVDGSDLAEYIFDSDGIGLEKFAENFGKIKCPEKRF
jgi:hypothetical protein